MPEPFLEPLLAVPGRQRFEPFAKRVDFGTVEQRPETIVEALAPEHQRLVPPGFGESLGNLRAQIPNQAVIRLAPVAALVA